MARQRSGVRVGDRSRLRREFAYHERPDCLAAGLDQADATHVHVRGAQSRWAVQVELVACTGEPRAPGKPLGDDTRPW